MTSIRNTIYDEIGGRHRKVLDGAGGSALLGKLQHDGVQLNVGRAEFSASPFLHAGCAQSVAAPVANPGCIFQLAKVALGNQSRVQQPWKRETFSKINFIFHANLHSKTACCKWDWSRTSIATLLIFVSEAPASTVTFHFFSMAESFCFCTAGLWPSNVTLFRRF